MYIGWCGVCFRRLFMNDKLFLLSVTGSCLPACQRLRFHACTENASQAPGAGLARFSEEAGGEVVRYTVRCKS